MNDDPQFSSAPAASAPAPARLAPDRTPVFRELPARPSQDRPNLETLRDVELSVQIELGRTRMRLEDVLQLHEGSVIELDRLAGDPVDVLVNGQLVARGEVVVLKDRFAVRVTEVVAPLREEQT